MPSHLRSAVGAAPCAIVLLLTISAAPSRAASSAATRMFLDNLVPNVDFLDRSARLALDHATSKRLKAFAANEARSQTAAIDAVYDWTQAPRALVAQAGAIPASVPNGSAGLDATPTGSVRVAWPPPATTSAAVDPRLPLGQEDLDAIAGLDGTDFDAAFKEKQADALAQVATDYADYIAKGDDAVLLALAKAQLPKVKAQADALKRLPSR